MHHESHQWHSPALGRELGLLVLGHGGARLLVFPTSGGGCREWIDREMHLVLGESLEKGRLQMFCVESVNGESWNAEHLHPSARAARHLAYDRYLLDEVLPLTEAKNGNPFLIAAGASMGGYHALCFGLRHPERVSRILSLSGMADIKRLTGGYSDDTVYACNPADFMRHEHDAARLDRFRRQDIILAIGEHDRMCDDNRELSATLWNKGIGNALRIWDGWAHDWPYWQRMLGHYIGGHD